MIRYWVPHTYRVGYAGCEEPLLDPFYNDIYEDFEDPWGEDNLKLYFLKNRELKILYNVPNGHIDQNRDFFKH